MITKACSSWAKTLDPGPARATILSLFHSQSKLLITSSGVFCNGKPRGECEATAACIWRDNVSAPNVPELSVREEDAEEDSLNCVNNDESCGYWASIGECEANPDFMESNCIIACGLCDDRNSSIKTVVKVLLIIFGLLLFVVLILWMNRKESANDEKEYLLCVLMTTLARMEV